VQGKIHFVLVEGVGRVKIVSGVAERRVQAAIDAAMDAARA